MCRPGKPDTNFGNAAAGRLLFDRNGNGVGVVFHQKNHRQALDAGGAERLEEFALAGHALAAGNQHHLVALVADKFAQRRALGLRQRAGKLLEIERGLGHSRAACSHCMPAVEDRDTMLSLGKPQCDGICRPPEEGSSLAPTACSSICSGVTPRPRHSARSR